MGTATRATASTARTIQTMGDMGGGRGAPLVPICKGRARSPSRPPDDAKFPVEWAEGGRSRAFPRGAFGVIRTPEGSGLRAPWTRMRLEKIEIAGFKSFADRQVVHVDEHVTGVIGPNGCGKSNIVDAVRWAMGERSAKQLRGGGMSDVIFAGCATRGPGAMAEVTLTFRNDEQDAPPPYHEYDRIAITRRLFADGTSEYLINKVPVRLRDIKELLMGTGAGARGYAIIEQGQVGKLVTSKPEERRHVIDEAAGITRFKAQKAAALTKIQATMQNLARVEDVLAELGSRLGTLERQAKKAQRYRRYREELTDLELWLASHAYFERMAEGGVLAARRDELARQVEDLRREIDGLEAKSAALRLDKARIEQDLSARQEELYGVDNRIRLIESEQSYRAREMESLASTIASAEAERAAVQRGLTNLEEELAAAEARRRRVRSEEGREVEAALAAAHARQEEIQRDLADRREALEAARRRQQEIAAEIARTSAERAAASAMREEIHARVRDDAEALAAATDRLEAAKAARDEALAGREALEDRVAEATRRRAELDALRAKLKQRAEQTEVALDAARAELQRARSRLQSLEEIEQRYQRCTSGVQVVLEHRSELTQARAGAAAEAGQDAVLGILADHVRAPEHLEMAVSAVLGDRLEAVVVDDPTVAVAGVELLKARDEGRTTFVPRTAVATEGPVRPSGWADPAEGGGGMEFVDLTVDGGVAGPAAVPEGAGDTRTALPEGLASSPEFVGRLADLVQAEAPYRGLVNVLLGDAVVVRAPLARALELWHRHRPSVPLVTTDGDRIDPEGFVTGGAPGALNAALLQQRREIEQLRGIVADLEAALEAARAEHLGVLEQIAAAEQDRDAAEAALRSAEAERARAEEGLRHAERAVAERAAEVERLEAEAEARRRALAEHAERLAALESACAELERERPEVEAAIETHERALAALGDAQREASEALAEAKVAHARYEEVRKTLDEASERLGKQVRSERARLERLEAHETSARERLEELRRATEEARAELVDLVERSKALSAQVHDVRERYEQVTLDLEQLEVSIRSLRGDLDLVSGQLGEVDLAVRENELERRHLVEDVAARCDVDLLEVLVDYHTRPMADEAAHARRKELRRIVSRMGDVNLAAIDEYEQVKERHTYLTGQREDLREAVEQLQEAIDRIDRETRQRFRETFDKVNEKFQQVFPRLFNGGRAELRLTDPNDLLNTGVEIHAQPPGKQLRSLELLSGGEKALTATSLIFAVFLIKPSPFCILDEVDAPLDDANVVRFCNLVRTLSERTQFIIITHNKITMELADRLYGVTMEQRGISKLVSVNMRRAVELAHA
ncbi:MAG: chromosome segregation protein SMC [Deltaproteobacteria bacterium]|nr:MAG: chromosome segregation protein SMC [Deltaproteobacteria bacterium]